MTHHLVISDVKAFDCIPPLVGVKKLLKTKKVGVKKCISLSNKNEIIASNR